MQETIYVKHEIANLISVAKIITIHYFEFGKHYRFRGERHDFWEIMYADRGGVQITSGQRGFALGQGELVFLRPNEYHNICADGSHPANVFIISFETKSHAMRYFEGKTVKLPPALKGLISAIITEGRSAFELPMADPKRRQLVPKPDAALGAQQLIRLYLEQLLILLLRGEQEAGRSRAVFTSKSKFDDHIVSLVVEALEQNVCGSIGVGELCARLGYGRTYLSGVFKRGTGQTIVGYYTALKIAEAKRLIREQAYTFTEIAEKLCFDTPQYFSRRFRQATGMSPREYEASVKVD